MTKEDNIKLAEWAGLSNYHVNDEGYAIYGYWSKRLNRMLWKSIPNFLKDFNSCKKWLIPKLNKDYRYSVDLSQTPGSLNWACQIVMCNCSVVIDYRSSPDDPVESLCQAILQGVLRYE